jgi:hypothetical protein
VAGHFIEQAARGAGEEAISGMEIMGRFGAGLLGLSEAGLRVYSAIL